MKTPALQTHVQHFTERNAALFALLGVVSLHHRLARLIPRAPLAAPDGVEVPDDRRARLAATEALLGLYAVTGRVRAHVQAFAREGAAQASAVQAVDRDASAGTSGQPNARTSLLR